MACRYYLNKNGERLEITESEAISLAKEAIANEILKLKNRYKEISKNTSLMDAINNNSEITPLSPMYVKNRVLDHFRMLSDGYMIPSEDMVIEAIMNPESFLEKYKDVNGEKVLEVINEYKDSAKDVDEIIDNLLNDNIGLEIDDIEVHENEVIMPNIYKNQFMMEDGDQPKDVYGPEYFEKKLNKRMFPQGGNKYDYYLRNNHGNHLYILVNGSDNYNKEVPELEKLDFPMMKMENGDIYRLSDDGEPLYKTNGLKFYKKYNEITNTNHEYVVLDDLKEINKLQQIASAKKVYNDFVINYGSKLNDDHEIQVQGLTYISNNGTLKQKELAERRLILIDMIRNKNRISNSDYLRANYTIDDINEKIEELNKKYDEVDDLVKHVINLKRLLYVKFRDNYDNDAVLNGISNDIINNEISDMSRTAKSYISFKSIENSPFKTLFDACTKSDLRSIASKNKKSAIEMYSSFRVSLGFSTARIPGQDKQSYMKTKIKHFLYNVSNIAMVNPYNLWFTGGDYDIDKVYSMGYSVKNGKIVGWSKYFNYYDEKNLNLSMLLPHPNGADVIDDPDGVELNINDIFNIKAFMTAFKNKNQSDINLVYKKFVHTMRKIKNNKVKATDFEGNQIPVENDILEFLNDYFKEDINDSLKEAGLFNTYIHELNMSSIDMANQVHHQRAMDMGQVQEAGKNPEKDILSNSVTPMNPANIAEFKETNMIGKQVIGIVATGLKVYSALCTYYMNKLNKKDFSNLFFNHDVMLRIKNEKGEYVDKDIIWNSIGSINFKRLTDSIDEVANFVQESEKGLSKEDFINAIVEMNEYNESTALVISSLLSAATDNAKELILGKINSGPETAGMYMHSIMMGNDFLRFSKLMTSKEADFFVNESKKQIFNPQTYNRNMDMFGNDNFIYNNYINLKSLSFDSKKKIVCKLYNLKLIEIQDIDISNIHNPDTLLSDFFKNLGKKIPVDLTNGNFEKASSTSNVLKFSSYVKQDSYDEFDYMDQSYIDFGQNEYGIDDFNYEDYDEKENMSSSDNYILEFHRAIDEVKKLNDKLDGLDMSKIGKLYNKYVMSKPLKDFGTLLSINQGVKSDQKAFLAHSKLIGKMIDSMMPKFKDEDEIKKVGFKVLTKPFSLKLFLTDESYRDDAISDFNKIKYDINYLDVIANTPHFFEMLKADLAVYSFQEQRSFKFRSINRIAQEFEGQFVPKTRNINYFVNGNQLEDISRYIDNAIIVRYLLDTDKSVVLPKGSEYIKNNDLNGYMKGVLENDTIISLNKPHGRATFIEWFENEVIKNLKNGKTLGTDGKLVDDPNLEDNIFIQGLTYDYNEDKLTKDVYQIIKPGFQMMNIKSDNDRNEFESNKIDFIKLANIHYAGQNLLDLFYLYNLIVNRNRNTSGSFTLMFEKSAELMNPDTSLYHEYSRYVSKIDMDPNISLGHNDFVGSEFYLSQEIPDNTNPESYIYRKVPNKKLHNEKYGYKFYVNEEESSLPIGYVDKYIALTGVAQLSSISRSMKNKIQYNPDVETNKQILNILAEKIREKFNINVNLYHNNNDLNKVKAFVDLGTKTINVNTAFASVAEPVHELLHLVLELVNMKDHDLYERIVSSIRMHPMYLSEAKYYSELEGLDLDEEVFVNIFSNYYNNKVQTRLSEDWNESNEDIFKDIEGFTDLAFSELFESDIKDTLNKSIFDLFKTNESFLNGRFSTLLEHSDEIINEGLENMKDKLAQLGMNKECN